MFATYHHDKPFPLEMGGELPQIDIAYHTFGTLNEAKDNVIWVCHALTANSDVSDWWPGTVEEGKYLDPNKYFVVCANILGSCYGTTGPMHTNPATGKPYYRDFPAYTIRDIVRAHQLLADYLGLDRFKVLVGCSVGGFQAVEWAVMEPERSDKLILMATDVKATPWTIAIDETQRMSILADETYYEDRPDGGRKGLAAARALGLLSYRGSLGYNITQQDASDDAALNPEHRACTYQRYQGEKLCRRFDAYSYMAILNSFDTHNIGRDRGGIDNALKMIKAKTIVIGLTTDIVFPIADMQALSRKIPNCYYREIQSPFGHDGFLVETDQLNEILIPFVESSRDPNVNPWAARRQQRLEHLDQGL